MSTSVFNFSAGPAMLPREVMLQAQREFLNWHGLGVSVMEISHRSQEFVALAEQTMQDFRVILQIPDNYKILFLHGGAQSQFSMIPMNFLKNNTQAAYVITGHWGQLAFREAQRFGQVICAASSEASKFTSIPDEADWKNYQDSSYLYYVSNETVHGVQFPFIPNASNIPLICDMSSDILSYPLDVSRFGMIFASAQKNLGAAGVTVAIIRDDLLEREPLSLTPGIARYQAQVESDSMYNTPATYSWYLMGLVLDWIQKQGGLAIIAQHNARKAKKLYDFIDASNFYFNDVENSVRSRMNVIFYLRDDSRNTQFLEQSKAAGLLYLKGHRALGGMRASIYNAMPEEGVDRLIQFMSDFEKQYG